MPSEFETKVADAHRAFRAEVATALVNIDSVHAVDSLPPPIIDAVPVGAPSPAATALGVLGAIAGGLMEAAKKAAAELDALKKDLTANPAIDSSASDAEAAATAADMPD